MYYDKKKKYVFNALATNSCYEFKFCSKKFAKKTM